MTLIELLLVLGLMLLLFSIILPQKQGIDEDLLLYQTVVNLENTLKLARHLSIDESTSYRIDIQDRHVTLRKYLLNTDPVYTFEIPANINVRITTTNVVYFNRNGASGYNRILVENNKQERYILETTIGTGRINISR